MSRITAFIFLLAAARAFAADPNMAIAANAINTLGLELLHRVAKPDQNALLSPYAIQSALAMTYAGADGGTRAEMAKVLHYPEDEAELHRSFAALRNALDEAVRQSGQYLEWEIRSGVAPDPISLKIANRLFGQAGYRFREPFLMLLQNDYAAPFAPVDFRKDAVSATKQINAWIGDQTQQRIEKLIADRELDHLTRLVLVNVLYFKSPWAEPFEKSKTLAGPFYLNSGESINVPMMTQRKDFFHAKGDGYTMVELPYRRGELQLLIVLPDEPAGLADLETRLSSGMLVSRSSRRVRSVTIHMPKFKLDPPPLALDEALRGLGVRSAFDIPPGSANFDRIAPRRPDNYLFMRKVFHKAYMSLDEKGAEAAAASAFGFELMGPGPEPVEVRVDHPFLFAILHRASGACLFLGRVVDPR